MGQLWWISTTSPERCDPSITGLEEISLARVSEGREVKQAGNCGAIPAAVRTCRW